MNRTENHEIGICVVSDKLLLREDLDQVMTFLHAIQDSGETVGVSSTGEVAEVRAQYTVNANAGYSNCSQAELFSATSHQARQFFSHTGRKNRFTFSLRQYTSLDDAVCTLTANPATFDIFFVDTECVPFPHTHRDDAPDPFTVLSRHCRVSRLSPHSKNLLIPMRELDDALGYVDGSIKLRVHRNMPETDRAGLLKLLLDHLDFCYLNKILARALKAADDPVALATGIYGFMQTNWPAHWDFHYYTGSMVANFIRSMHRLSSDDTTTQAPRCLTGNNEHSLAAGALAGWQLYQRAYVITVTSGMIDEFRGTLSNLHRARAPGLIICADSPEQSWYAFQGTLDPETDGRQVIAARGIPHFYIHERKDIPAQLGRALARLRDEPGPVFIFATPGVLESREHVALEIPAPRIAAVADAAGNSQREAQIDAAVEIINHSRTRLLWYCGPLSAAQRKQVYQIAERAGIGLADALTHPGSVSPYEDGTPNPNYLGACGVYAFSRRLYHFLHQNGKLHDVESQCLFFLKSKIDQAATPFSDSKLARNLRIVQVNKNTAHISPFTDIALSLSLNEFLDTVLQRLDVDPQVLALRREALHQVQQMEEGVPVDYLDTLPMSASYFTMHMGKLVHRLIQEENYRYTGVYDVGRGGLSALRNIPRTDPGFSGWYGRALMGDALSALPYIARTSRHNVLAFIGDGARALVPDIHHRLAEALANNPRRGHISVNLFYLCNGVLSMIRTYLDARSSSKDGSQVVVPARLDTGDFVQSSGDVPVYHHRFNTCDTQHLHTMITRRGAVNIAEVLIAHDSDGDGLSLLSESAWHRAECG
ncbi:hypothetical protein [Microbulbifer sp.]|uniref:hypothetical protein n=1 Tax=Microbulbifer sp. TaxID=1908541 RepID=UPI0025856094|nr:hypothetical protein [Microbulbifer sp.]